MAIIILEHSDLSGSGRLGEQLRNVGHRLRVIELHHGHSLPIDLDDVDGVVTCGGGMSVNDSSIPWIEEECEFLRKVHQAELPIIGLCLGSQLMAKAFGGKVGDMEGGPEIGFAEVTQTRAGQTDILHAGIGWKTMQCQWHHQMVTDLPDGATVLSTSEKCAVQAWMQSPIVYGFQYHPEATFNTIMDWADDEPSALEKVDMSQDDLIEACERELPDMYRTADRLFERISLLIMPVDRRFAGISKDLHH